MARFLLVLVVAVAMVAVALGGEYDGVDSYSSAPVAERRGDLGLGGHGGGYGGGYGGGWGGWSYGPRFRYLNFRIPVPILPRIRLGLGWETPAKGWW